MSQAHQPKPAGSNTTIDDFMGNDDGIDSLTPLEVKEAYVRAKLAETYMKLFSDRPGGFSAQPFQEAMEDLEGGCRFRLGTLLKHHGRKGYLSRNVREIAENNITEDLIIALYDLLTDESMDDETRVRKTRSWLKRKLDGSLGMPDDRVVRTFIDNR